MSSSSSMCDFEEFYNYYPVRNYQEPWFDYYQSMGHPLVYYAEVQPTSRQGRSGVRKDPNFFVKAFRWYTQEHYPPHQDRNKAVNNPDLSGFANWLDDKYGQFLQEGQRVQANQLTAPEPPKSKKIFATMKSHLTRRHKAKKDVARQKRSCNSCEFIMKPKEMSLTGSDFQRSNVKAVCSDTRDRKSAMKSVSMNSRYDEEFQKSIEIMVTEGDTNDKPEDTCSCTKTEVLTIFESKLNQINDAGYGPCVCKKPDKVDACSQYDNNTCACAPILPAPVTPAAQVPLVNETQKYTQGTYKNKPSVTSLKKNISKLRKTPKTSDMSCLCSMVRVPTKSSRSRHECKCTASFHEDVNAFYQKDRATEFICPCMAQLPPPASLAPIMTPVALPPAPVGTTAKTGCLCSLRVNGTMQTSDMSIRLDDEVIKYPFFMKIVRADKLITDC